MEQVGLVVPPWLMAVAGIIGIPVGGWLINRVIAHEGILGLLVYRAGRTEQKLDALMRHFHLKIDDQDDS